MNKDEPEIDDEAPNVYRECALLFIAELDRILAFIAASENKTLSVYCLAFAMGRTSITQGDSQVEIAKRLGVKRATVSRCVKQIQSRFGNSIAGVQPMPGQRSLVACEKFSQSRKGVCK